MRSSFVYVRTECTRCIKLLINVNFLQIRLITNSLVQILFALTVCIYDLLKPLLNITVINILRWSA